jgi:hypothetical protein
MKSPAVGQKPSRPAPPAWVLMSGAAPRIPERPNAGEPEGGDGLEIANGKKRGTRAGNTRG